MKLNDRLLNKLLSSDSYSIKLSWALTYSCVVILIDLTQARTQEQQLRKLLQEQGVASVSALKKPNAPYPGMSAFNEADAGRFWARTGNSPICGFLYENRCLVIIGAWVNSKSSRLVYAGIVPALQNSQLFGQDGWRIIKLRRIVLHFNAGTRSIC